MSTATLPQAFSDDDPLQPVLDDGSLPSSDQLICDDGEPMETWRHRQQMDVLINSLSHAWRERTDYFVGGNMFLYFSAAQVRNNDFKGPDVFVVMNTTRRERRAWVTWEEGGRTPNVIIELLSDSTEHVDRVEKMDIYARVLKVPEYVLFDPFSGVLEGYALDAAQGVYVRKALDEHGRVTCAQLGLSLGKVRSTLDGTDADWLRWFGPDGQVLPVFREYAVAAEQRLGAAEEYAETESNRADAAEEYAETEGKRADAAEMRAGAAEMRAGAAEMRAGAAEMRAEAAHSRAEAEGKRADAAEEHAEAARRRAQEAGRCARETRRCATELLLCMLPLKFGPLSDEIRERIAQASVAQLQRWAALIPSAHALQDVFRGDE